MRKVMGPVSPGPNDESNLWKPGQSGNPAGRPPGARNRLSEAFLRDMMAAWEAHGAAAIETMVTERPHEFVKLVAGLLPRKFELKASEYDDFSDDELNAQLGAVLRGLAASGFDIGAALQAEGEPQPTLALPSLAQTEDR
jgi:hypothetical protein